MNPCKKYQKSFVETSKAINISRIFIYKNYENTTLQQSTVNIDWGNDFVPNRRLAITWPAKSILNKLVC